MPKLKANFLFIYFWAMHEVLIYGGIFSFTADQFIQQVQEAEGGDLTVRLNSGGGDPIATFGMVAKFNEFNGDKLVKVDGEAMSSAFFFIAMVENVEALDVSRFMIHRAAFDPFIENSEFFTEEMKAQLTKINSDLRSAFEKKVDVKAFEAISGVKVKEIFSLDHRKEVFLTAKEAKKIGLINRINKVTPTMKAEIDKNVFAIAANYSVPVTVAEKTEIVEQSKNDNMTTIDEIKAKYPVLYASIVNVGVLAERDRTGAWMVGVEVDAKAVTEGIKGGEAISQTALAEFSMKAMAAVTATTLEGESAETIAQKKIDAKEQTPEQKIEAQIGKDLNLKAYIK